MINNRLRTYTIENNKYCKYMGDYVYLDISCRGTRLFILPNTGTAVYLYNLDEIEISSSDTKEEKYYWDNKWNDNFSHRSETLELLIYEFKNKTRETTVLDTHEEILELLDSISFFMTSEIEYLLKDISFFKCIVTGNVTLLLFLTKTEYEQVVNELENILDIMKEQKISFHWF